MFGSKYLLLELDRSEAEFYHLPVYVPYLKKHQTNLQEFGFEWELAVEAMKLLTEEMDADEYRLYKLFIKKWDYYKTLASEIKSESWKEAEKIIDKILSIDLLDPSAYLNLGFIFRKLEGFPKAEQAYLKGLELLPNNAPFLAGLARTYDESAQKDKAAGAWQRVLKYSEDKEEAFEKLVEYKVYKKIGDEYLPSAKYEEAMEKDFERNYDDINALTQLGLRLIQENYSKLALKVFARVYELSKKLDKDVTEHIPENIRENLESQV